MFYCVIFTVILQNEFWFSWRLPLQKLKTAKIHAHVFQSESRKFSDMRIVQFRVYITLHEIQFFFSGWAQVFGMWSSVKGKNLLLEVEEQILSFWSWPLPRSEAKYMYMYSRDASSQSRNSGSSVGLGMAYWSSGPKFDPCLRRNLLNCKRSSTAQTFRYQPSISLIWLKYFWKGRKIACHPSILSKYLSEVLWQWLI